MFYLQITSVMTHIPPAFVQPVQFLIFNILWTYIASVVTGNVSQVDRVWTFLPTLYTAYFAFYPLLDGADPSIKSRGVSPRVLLMLALQVYHHKRRYRLITDGTIYGMPGYLDGPLELQHLETWSLQFV